MNAQSKAAPSAKTLGLVWLATIALVGGFVVFLFQFGPLAAKSTAFRQTAHGWEPLPPLATLGTGIDISGAGVAWVQTLNGLSRLDGASWRSFTVSGCGAGPGYLHGFALDGDQVWAIGPDAVIRFDGKRCRSYPNISTRQGASIAALNGQVWVVDRDGNLSHFDGNVWAVRKVNLPGVKWSAWSGPIPTLAATANGALWLAYQGLWRYDGSSWTRVSGATGKAEVLGAAQPGPYVDQGKKIVTRGAVWVRDEEGVVGFDVDGAKFVRYQPRDLGLTDSATLYDVAGRAPVFAVASSQGLVWFDGSTWHHEQLKQLGMVTPTSVAVAPDGTVWGIGHPPVSAAIGALYRAAALIILFLPLITIGYTVWWFKRRARHQRQATREAVLHATGTPYPQASEPSGVKSSAGVVMALALGFGVYWQVRKHWPDAPVWLLPAFFVAAHIVSTVMGSLKKRKPLPSDPIGPGGPPRYEWAKSSPAILGGLAVILLLYGGSIARHFHIPLLAAVPGIAFLFGGRFLFGAFDMFRARRVEREIKRCHYAQALQMLDGPLGWPPTGLWKLSRVDALFYSGRAAEAEPILRELVETQSNAAHKTLAFEMLGRVLMAQSRYADAKRAFEAAAKLMPTRPAAPSGLAELRLLQDTEPALALADAQRALQLHRDSLLQRKGARERLAGIRGNQAWALAVLGRSAESQQAIAAGVREMDPNYTPEVAGFYWRAGMAMLATGNSAAGHFRRAAELDPQGYYGSLATQHLRQHSVWGAVELSGSRR